jgi:hypothetical protein
MPRAPSIMRHNASKRVPTDRGLIAVGAGRLGAFAHLRSFQNWFSSLKGSLGKDLRSEKPGRNLPSRISSQLAEFLEFSR